MIQGGNLPAACRILDNPIQFIEHGYRFGRYIFSGFRVAYDTVKDAGMADNHEGILRESDSTELEVLVFKVGELGCGVNVAKVREVIKQVHSIRVPQAHPALVGVINLRGQVIPLVDLQLYFNPGEPSSVAERQIIVTEFSDMLMGFVVDGVEQIYRLTWKDLEPLPASQGSDNSVIAAVCHVGERLVLMVDFDKVALEFRDVCLDELEQVSAPPGLNRGEHRILLAEDSPTMRQYIYDVLVQAGYTQTTLASNGEDAWEQLEHAATPYELMISDVEMPRMDGLHLVQMVREKPRFNDMRVVIFSALITDENREKMSALGADAVLIKPQLAKLVEAVDGLFSSSGAPV